MPRTGFNPDESRWLHRAHYLSALADPVGPTWEDQYLTRGQPPLGSYMTGLGLLLQGRDLETNGSWNFEQTAATNADRGNMPTYDDLLTSRRTSALLMALTVGVVFLIGTRLAGWLAGLAGALTLAVHPFSSYIGSLATADALLGLLIALAALAAMRLAERPSWPRAIALGLLLGLGGATKLSPLLLALPLALFGGALLVIARRWSRPAALGSRLLSVPLTAAMTFVAVYPYLWPAPLRHTLNLFTFRAEEMATQAHDWPGMAVPTRAEALARIGENFHNGYSIVGRVETTLGAALGTALVLPRLELALAVAGLLILAVLAIRQGFTSQPMLALLSLGGQVAITVAGMRSEFDRYHLPMAILAAVCIGLVVAVGATAVRTLAARPRRASAPRRLTSRAAPGAGYRLPAMTTNRAPSAGAGRR